MTETSELTPTIFRPLAGIKVLDLSRYLPGPFLTRILRDLGAEVVKVEPLEGEAMRFMPPRVNGLGATFASLEADKESVAIDLKKKEGVALLKALAAEADILVEAFRPGKLAALGLDFPSLQQANPRLILCSITGNGQTGSRAQVAGHDLNYLATTGLLHLFGPPDAPPTVPGVQLADVAGGSLPAAIGILGALLERQQTGRGRHLDINMTLGALAFAANAYPTIAAGAVEPRGKGMLTGGAPAYRCYQTRDGRFIALAGMEPHFFATFCTLVGHPEWAPLSYRTDAKGAALAESLRELFLTRSAEEWMALCDGHDICINVVRTPEEAMADPEFASVIHSIDGLKVVSSAVGAPTEPPRKGASALGSDALEVTRRWNTPVDVRDAAIASGALLWRETPTP